jgi:16S rRNA (guanine527-N7)-methyltransferase
LNDPRSAGSWGNLPVPPDPLHWSADADERLRRWLDQLLATPGLTSISDREEARRVHVEDSLRALPLVQSYGGSIVDVGSGGGAPGIPLAAALPEREVTLLESNRRKTTFLERVAAEFPNVRVVWGRAEEQEVEQFGVAVAKALAPPPVAAEWCLPLVRLGGAAVLWVGPSADIEAVKNAGKQLGATAPEDHGGLLVLRKVGPTPPGFPRRSGMARKRPLA